MGNSGSRRYAGYPDYYFSWSVLAQLNPYLEQTNIYNTMDLKQPIYQPPTYNVTAANQFAVQQIVKLFLCPSDRGVPVSVAYGEPVIGPTNYAACLGSGTTNGGAPFGSPLGRDGMFQAVRPFKLADVTDGLSNTACMSESILGDGAENATGAAPGDRGPSTRYLGFTGTAINDANCAARRRPGTATTAAASCGRPARSAAPLTTTTTRRIPRTTTASTTIRSAGYTASGFRAARSRHTGGVNLLLGDGSVRFVNNSVDPLTWRRIGTTRRR